MRRRIALVAAIVFTFAFTVAAAAEDGAALFKARCAPCHGPDGSGQTPMGKNLKVKSLRSDEVKKLSDDELASVISKGRNKMPSFATRLSADQIKTVIAYIRTLK